MSQGRIEKLEAALIESSLRAAAAAEGAAESAVDDVLLHDRNFVVGDDGRVRTPDGLSPRDWMRSMRESRPHWFSESSTGSTDAHGKKATGPSIPNPWLKQNWSLTKQGEVVKTLGEEKAQEMARAAGVTIGATRPVK